MGGGVHPDQWLHRVMAAGVVFVAPTTLARDRARSRSPAEDRYNGVEGNTTGGERRRTRVGMHAGRE